ncbi:tyrosine-protein phosphatase [Chengkuizengella axinellae]|uniref:Tyrosine-protein phosphatase n=1 Tax=Chengkuizengella axinellae TaxID=3064388 RepID=A0ABT9IZF8_9BACL|nr:CpsB/CapC family capsule biosynthesis tyrosine phosphatase [Chengkuizengella sp. 2205SS18-9]MDP5274747.1 CpsB/CapC family capsule biosynthesis tyrosine phosphatase [Chengkuizengella sp. 2205SS18-9]
MIDLHSHILPGLDDGAKDLEESKQLAKEAVKQGITKMIATPHHRNGSYYNSREEILTAVERLNEELDLENIQLEICPGQETRIYGEMVQDVKQGELLTLNDDDKYIFVELPSNHVPRYTNQLLFDMQLIGLKPIIVHPERNQELIEHPEILYKLVKNGALTQVTAASVIGKFGKKIQKFSNQLIENHQTHFIASDVHHVTRRGFYLKEACEYINQEFGSNWRDLLLDNSQRLIDGKMIHYQEPQRIKRKKIFGIF